MESKKKILVIENQFTQFKEIIKLLDGAGFQSFPSDESSFKDYLDWIRIYLDPRYTLDRRNRFWDKILEKTIEYNAEVFIIDHILVGSHDAEDGIDLAIKFRDCGLKQPFIFFSRTDINNIDICDRLPKVSLKKEWIFKGYSGADILEERFFEKEVIPKIEKLMEPNILPTVVILTAIKEEYEAVRKHLKQPKDAVRDDTSFETGIFELSGKEIANIFIRECGQSNILASQDTERAIQYFKPNTILFVGIAGSRKPRDFSLGDVIFPKKIYSYEGGKSEEKDFFSRPDFGPITFTLEEIAKREGRKGDWKTLVKGEWQLEEIKADLGVIASGEKLVEHYDSEIGEILTQHFNDTQAVETEGFGFAKAASRQGRKMNGMMIGVVRGISDIIEQPSGKEHLVDSDRRPANDKKLASDTAAAFAFWLILKTYEDTQ